MQQHTNTKKLSSKEKVSVLKSLNIFKDAPENILADIASLMQEEEYEKGASIFTEGSKGDCMYIIYKGKVRIHKKKTELAILNEKEEFGELSLLDAETRSASATADTDCFLYKINQEPFYKLIDTRPEIARGFFKILCQRLRSQNEKSISLKK